MPAACATLDTVKGLSPEMTLMYICSAKYSKVALAFYESDSKEECSLEVEPLLPTFPEIL